MLTSFQLKWCFEFRDIISFIKSKISVYQDAPNFDSVNGLEEFVYYYSGHLSKTLYLYSKEASGYAMLSLHVCTMMEQKYPQSTFKIDPQFHVSEEKNIYLSGDAERRWQESACGMGIQTQSFF